MDIGDAIGPYIIDRVLGQGGMGCVYRARDSRLGREVALKQLSDPSLTTERARRRVLQEARAAAGLSHPNIATIFDVLDAPEGPTIVMEYVPGESLARLLARGPLPPGRAIEIAGQIADGLGAAHARGIIHRDLKPANIQITPDGQAKILDFGIAQLAQIEDPSSAPTMTSDAECGRLAGTPGYMAPEQLGGGRADARSDVYALGILLYEMLTGRRPFPAADPIGNAMAVLKGGAPPVAEIVPATPPAISALVARAMAREPRERFQSAAEMARALRQELRLAGETVSRVTPRAGARRTAAILTVAAALILAGAGWHWSRRALDPAISAQGSVFAVLPFTNASADATDDPIAVGLTEAVANRLSSLEAVRLLSLDQAREAAASVRGDPSAAARALGARFVVDAELRRAGRTLDVDVSLVGADGTRRSAGRYTGDIAQVFDLHQRIAQGVIAALTSANAVSGTAAPNPGPTSNQQAFAEYAQARLFLERPDVPMNVDHAIRLFQSAISKDDRFALAYAGLGQASWAKYAQTQDPVWTTRATAAILDALRIDPDQPEVRLSLAVMYQGLGRLDAAEEELRRVLALQPWNDDAHRLAAGVRIDQGDWDGAVEELRQAIALRPNYWRNHSELGYAHYRAGRLDEAVAAYERVVELQPDSALGYHMLGTLHQSAGRLPAAIENYEKAITIRPRFTTYSNIGTIHFWNGDYSRAAEAYRRAIALAPNRHDFHANLGDALVKLGQRDRARASYRSAVEEVQRQLAINQNDAVSLSRLALYLAKLGDRAGADAAASRAVALNPDDGEVLYAVAMADALAGRAAAACDRLGKALAGGASAELARRSDELRALQGCAAYDRIAARQ